MNKPTLETIVKYLTKKIERLPTLPGNAKEVHSFDQAQFSQALDFMSKFSPVKSKRRCICFSNDRLYAFELPKETARNGR